MLKASSGSSQFTARSLGNAISAFPKTRAQLAGMLKLLALPYKSMDAPPAKKSTFFLAFWRTQVLAPTDIVHFSPPPRQDSQDLASFRGENGTLLPSVIMQGNRP
jgi:hypothetical protein